MQATDTNIEEYDAVIVGGGFGGVHLLHRLRERGFSVKLIEAGAELGGVWYWNCYPGARVDSHAPNYELSIESLWRDWNWSERFPNWSELREYFRYVEKKLDLSDALRLNTRVNAARFDESAHQWQVETDDGASLRCRYFLLCTGFASKPFTPDLPGLESFQGPCHHTAEWPQQGLDFTGKRVGVVGTGASAIQVIQQAAKHASELVVFQRTPNTALPMRQERLDAATQDAAKDVYPAFFERRRKTFGGFDFDFQQGSIMALSPDEREAAFEELWNQGGLQFWTGNYMEVLIDPAANEEAYRFWRKKTLPRIQDPELAEKLAPEQQLNPFGTKRPSLEQGYFEVFNQDNVTLVDVKESPIEAVTANGVRTGDAEYELDILVMGTGFDAVTGGLKQIDIRSTAGATFDQHWADGLKTQLGLACAGFPNLFFLYGPQSPSGFSNGPAALEVQSDWVAECLDYLSSNGYTRIEAENQAEAAWREHVNQVADMTLFPKADSWYMGANVPGKKREMLQYPGGIPMYSQQCEASAAQGYARFDKR